MSGRPSLKEEKVFKNHNPRKTIENETFTWPDIHTPRTPRSLYYEYAKFIWGRGRPIRLPMA
jgi:hypothetical protein